MFSNFSVSWKEEDRYAISADDLLAKETKRCGKREKTEAKLWLTVSHLILTKALWGRQWRFYISILHQGTLGLDKILEWHIVTQ